MITQQEVKNTLALAECVRFREISTNLLFDCKIMDNGVIVRQCPPFDWNISMVDFDEFIERFEVSYVAS